MFWSPITCDCLNRVWLLQKYSAKYLHLCVEFYQYWIILSWWLVSIQPCATLICATRINQLEEPSLPSHVPIDPWVERSNYSEVSCSGTQMSRPGFEATRDTLLNRGTRAWVWCSYPLGHHTITQSILLLLISLCLYVMSWFWFMTLSCHVHQVIYLAISLWCYSLYVMSWVWFMT